MMKIIGTFWLFVFGAAVAGFIWLGISDVPVEQNNVTIDIPASEIIQ